MIIDLSNIKREKIEIEEEIFKLDHCSWESLYEKDKANGHLIMINEWKVIKEGLKANQDSLFDSRFNIPTDIDQKITEYACDCERLIGRYNEGEVCPSCNTVVEIKYSIELLRRGWIDLENYFIIIPAMYNKIRAFIGRKRLEDIIYGNVDNMKDPSFKIDPSNPFKGIGLLEFRKRYIEILNFFKHTTNKPELFDILIDRKDITFSSKIYVMSSAHRPGFISSKHKTFQYHNINALFVKIIRDLDLIKKGRRSNIRDALGIMNNIQQYLMQIHDLTIAKLPKKERLIRNNIISSRLWYSSRMVIISETTIDDIDSVRMSYKGFLGMFELEIMNAMLRGYGNPEFARMTTTECHIYLTKCKYSNKIDEYIYSIIKALIHNRKDDGIWVIINRNPSFDLGSIQTFRVADVFRDVRKNVLTIPHNSLAEFNGDFDGDTLNVYSPKEKCVVEAFKEGFRPSKLILDRTGEYFNPKMAPIKDEYAFIKCFSSRDFKPINPKKSDLKSTEEILKKLKTPFNYKYAQALLELDNLRKSIIYDEKKFICDPVDHIESRRKKKKDEEYVRTSDSYDPMDLTSKNKLCYDPFVVIDRDTFLKAD